MGAHRLRHAALGRVVVVAIAVAALAGCGADNLAPAGGTVRVDGKLACGGRVVFLPVGGGLPAIGEIDSSGHFTLTSGGRHAGATIASHHIVLNGVRCARDDEGKSYRAAEATRVAVEGDVENSFDLNIDLKNGWQIVAED